MYLQGNKKIVNVKNITRYAMTLYLYLVKKLSENNRYK